ncbi:MAG: hypothetical protein J6J12_01810 [Oscillospiraceae bacterium]|nr:hypothetical protein [Oscillospiraceae bacterium]
MEQYREKVKKQNIILSICSVILALCSGFALASELELLKIAPAMPASHWISMWRGFVGGASTGLLCLTLFALIRNLFALKDDRKLRKLYVKTHDERTLQLFHNARSAAMSVFLIGGLIAVIVTGYFNPTVSLTILACVMVCSSLCLWFKVYYDKKY